MWQLLNRNQQFALSSKNLGVGRRSDVRAYAHRLALGRRVARSIFATDRGLGHESAPNAVGGGGDVVDGLSTQAPRPGARAS
jgi:hypothetical protein